ncbi:MAG TPA: response regulator [Candidatus Rifleibacterium sp.]|nr:response regulator [Candidatus Rifleibacterium sp.]HPT45094.1 response regulator [Candidatus Rifleibacterium sp.]
MKILVVEDDEATREVMLMGLRGLGHETAVAADGRAGLQVFNTFKPDIVFADIQMPVMNGLEMLEKLRKIDSDSLVIINTTLDSPEYTLQALRLKANDYLIKPVLLRDIVAILEKYSDVLKHRTFDREVLGMITRRELCMEIGNDMALLGKIVDRLLLETECAIKPNDRLGIRLGLMEILINAVEHGNLAVSYEEKSHAIESGPDGLEKLIEERMHSSPYQERRVKIEFSLTREQCSWLVTDGGIGFDFENLPDPNDPENLIRCHGRGIMLARLQFDECSFLGTGNQVRMVKRLP